MSAPLIILTVCASVILFAICVLIGGSYYGYRMAFYLSPEKKIADPYRVIKGDGSEWDEHRRALIDGITAQEFSDVYITASDGARLHGYLKQVGCGDKFAILFHGYKSTPFLDFSGGAPLLMENGYSILMIDQRSHGKSDGKTISFGVRESDDALLWAKYVSESFPKCEGIVLVGISMGAATVLLASCKEGLDEKVRAVIADCPYSTADAIIKKVITEDMHLPGALYPFAEIGARLFGGFNLKNADCDKAAKSSRVPILLIHGEGDDFVPHFMSVKIAEGADRVRFESFPEATHGTSYLFDSERYKKITAEFLDSAQKG